MHDKRTAVLGDDKSFGMWNIKYGKDKEMKKGEIGEGIIQKVEFPNKCMVLTEEGEKVIVKNGVAGQRVRFSIQKKRNGKCEGRLLEVLEKSPLEMEKTACEHFGSCGGCTYQNLNYEQQIRLKESQVKEMLLTVVKAPDQTWFEGIKPSPLPFGYRNKMEFSFGDEYKDGPLALGMHRRGSFYDIVTVDHCVITDEDFNQILKTACAYFSNEQVSYFKKNSHIGYLRHLLVRKAAKTGEILIDLITTTQSGGTTSEPELLEGFQKALLQLQLKGNIVGILHTKNDSVADAVKNEGTEVLYGQEYFYEELLGLRFKISTFSFFQTNSLGAEVLYKTVREYLKTPEDGKAGVIYDLYSGTGTIAQMMAPAAKKVIGVEIVEEAVQAARENAKLNGLDNCEFIAGDVLKVLETINERPDMIILDPPREGVHPKALKKILDYGVDRMVYISCKPTSLVRDLEVMQECGYCVVRGGCVDLFPGTYHVESIVLLSKLHTKQNIEVELEISEMDLTAAESKATYEEIKDYVLEHTGLKVSSLYIAQVKQKCGIIERANYNMPKSEKSRQPKCPPEKEAAIREALKHFRMI